MRGVLYHIRIELYRHEPHSYLPKNGLDIFTGPLPVHQVKQLPSSTSTSSQRRASVDQRAGEKLHNTQTALLLPERNAALKNPASPPATRRIVSEESAAQDWRFGPVCVDSINMSLETRTQHDGANASKTSHTKAVYIPATVSTSNVGWGVVHLYRDGAESDPPPRLDDKRTDTPTNSIDLDHCMTLCILAVPSWMMTSDLLGFVGEQTRSDVSHFRLIRTDRANRYMVLMKFRSTKRAKEWQTAWNGRLFSAMEPETCHVVFVSSVDFVTPDSQVNHVASFPQSLNDPFVNETRDMITNPNTSSAKPYAPPTPALVELPTCPVCLERMDDTTGLLTILCQHVFHCACLEKWRGSGCPVCRYTQSPSHTFPYPRPHDHADDQETVCSVCATTASLWICLICGNTGCGRYDSAHAYAHYESTSHCYAMDISTQRVWDYAGDGYVHRLIQNKDNTKLIHLPGAQHNHPNNAYRAEGDDSVPREKMEAMANEYTFLLTNQLDSQRRYYEEQLDRAVDKASKACLRAEEAADSVAAIQSTHTTLSARAIEQKQDIERLDSALQKSTLRADKFEKLARDLSKQIKEETTMSSGLMSRITQSDVKLQESLDQIKGLEAAKRELEDMNRDLTIFISSQDKIRELEAQGEEIEGSTAQVGQKQSKRKGKNKT